MIRTPSTSYASKFRPRFQPNQGCPDMGRDFTDMEELKLNLL